MSKKNDLKIVFDFIAEYLKDEENVSVENKKVLVEETKIEETKIEETKIEKPKYHDLFERLNLKNENDNIAHIKNLMDRVDYKYVEQANTNSLLANQRKEFEAEIKKLKEQINEGLKVEKLNEEGVIVSGNTVNIITENGSEKIVIDNEIYKSTFERKLEE
jgi:hypothetical protein